MFTAHLSLADYFPYIDCGSNLPNFLRAIHKDKEMLLLRLFLLAPRTMLNPGLWSGTCDLRLRLQVLKRTPSRDSKHPPSAYDYKGGAHS
jgi:hypothetical protein